MTQCGAKTRGGGKCKQKGMPNGRCRMHGGLSLAGLASPSFKDGRYSKYLPARLAGRYKEAQADSELLAMREDVALTDARLADVLSRVDQGDSAALWKAAQDAFGDLMQAQALGLPDRAARSVLSQVLAKGIADWEAWDEIAKLLEQRRRLVESERKRLVDMQQTITAERAMLLIGAIAGIIRAHVDDPVVLTAITRDIGKLVDSGAPGAIGAPT